MPALPSVAQSGTSRRNGARSRGPVTAAGKAASAANGVRHGLCAARMSLGEAEQAHLRALEESLAATLAPADAAEAYWVRQMAMTMLRRERLDAIEARVTRALLEEPEAGPPAGLPSMATIARHRARLERDQRQAAGELAAARALRGQSAVPAVGGTNEPEAPTRSATGGARPLHGAASSGGTDEPEAPARPDPTLRRPRPDAPAPRGTPEPEKPAAPALNRAQRRRLEAMRRHEAAA